jgi:hypothetical protein
LTGDVDPADPGQFSDLHESDVSVMFERLKSMQFGGVPPHSPTIRDALGEARGRYRASPRSVLLEEVVDFTRRGVAGHDRRMRALSGSDDRPVRPEHDVPAMG